MTEDGDSLLVDVMHFSGGGTSSITEQDFERFVAQLATFPLNLELAGHFFRDFRAVPVSWCDSSHPTCHALKGEISRFLGTLTDAECLDAARGSFIDLHLNVLNVLISLESDAAAQGLAGFPRIADCRQLLTTSMYDLTREPARTDALGLSNPCSGVRLSQADYDGNGKIVNAECMMLVAAQAQVQGFNGLAAVAIARVREGLQKVLNEGIAKCNGTNFLDGEELLSKGLAIASQSVLEVEFQNALADCEEKITVAPNKVTLAPGAQVSFTATTNYLSPDIRWSASGGTIPSVGNTVQYTAPSAPGTYTITATDFLIPGISGTATVMVPGGAELATRTDYAAVLSGGVATEEVFPGAPLEGTRSRNMSAASASVNHSTSADDAGGKLAFSAEESAQASGTAFNNGGTSHEEISFTTDGPVQISCAGTTADDGVENENNQSGAAVIIDGVSFEGDTTIDYQAVLGPGAHTLETYAFAEATGAGKSFDASTSVTCTTT